MTTRWFLACLLAGACGNGGGPPASGADAGPDIGGTPAATRPPNPTCGVPARAVPLGTDGLPARLSETGCFDPADVTRPLPALLPYTVNAPLWSDGADKDRWLALPDGARIRVLPDGDLELPPGSALIKTFRLGARRVETRFFVRHPGGDWSGYTYEWNEAGTDAVLLRTNGAERHDRRSQLPVPDAGRVQAVPHRRRRGIAGPGARAAEHRRRAMPGRRGTTSCRSGRTWVCSRAACRRRPPTLPALPRAGDSAAPLERRARAYLHANCAGCHRPEVDMSGSVDLRFATPLAATMSCDHRPVKGTQGFGAAGAHPGAGQPRPVDDRAAHEADRRRAHARGGHAAGRRRGRGAGVRLDPLADRLPVSDAAVARATGTWM